MQTRPQLLGQEKAELPNIRFHDLRHTVATLLLARGRPPEGGPGAPGPFANSVTLDNSEAAGKLDRLLTKPLGVEAAASAAR